MYSNRCCESFDVRLCARARVSRCPHLCSVHRDQRGSVRAAVAESAARGAPVPVQSRDGWRVASLAAALELLAHGAGASVRQHVRAVVVRAGGRQLPRPPAGLVPLRRRRCASSHLLFLNARLPAQALASALCDCARRSTCAVTLKLKLHAGLMSSLGSHLWKVSRGHTIPSLGAVCESHDPQLTC